MVALSAVNVAVSFELKCTSGSIRSPRTAQRALRSVMFPALSRLYLYAMVRGKGFV